jgi:hypothetical protein
MAHLDVMMTKVNKPSGLSCHNCGSDNLVIYPPAWDETLKSVTFESLCLECKANFSVKVDLNEKTFSTSFNFFSSKDSPVY